MPPFNVKFTPDLSRTLEIEIASPSQEFREVLLLPEWNDLTYREISDPTNIPIGAVMSRLSCTAALGAHLPPLDFS